MHDTTSLPATAVQTYVDRSPHKAIKKLGTCYTLRKTSVK